MTACAMSYDGSYLTVSNGTTVYRLNSNSTGFSLAVGSEAGRVNQATNAIAIGQKAGQVNQSANSIVLNATGSALATGASGLYVAPVATITNSASDSISFLGYGDDKQVVQTGFTYGLVNNSSNILDPYYYLNTGFHTQLRIEGPRSGTSTSTLNANYFSFGGNGVFGIDAPNVGNGRFVVTNSGTVGIGRPSPQESGTLGSLDVGGAIYNGTGANVGGQGVIINTGWVNPLNYYEWAPLKVSVRGTPIFNVNTNGYVGIGTTSPSNSLDVVGTVQASTAFQSNSSATQFTGGGSMQNVYLGQYGAAAPRGTSVRFGDILGAAYYITTGGYDLSFYKDNSGGNANLVMAIKGINATNTTPSVYFANSVGIGTTSPGYALDVVGSIKASNTLYATYYSAPDQRSLTNYFKPNSQPSSTFTVGFYGGTATGYGDGIHFNTYVDSSGGKQNLVLFSKDTIGMRIYQGNWQSSSAYSTYMDAVMANSSGNVGIGTSNPLELLHLNNGVPILRMTGTNSIDLPAQDTIISQIKMGGATYFSGIQTVIPAASYQDYVRLDLCTVTAGGTSTMTPRISIHGFGGNVGIGTTNPTYKLYVVGDIYASGNITGLSDRRFKTNIEPLIGALDAVSMLNGYTYFRPDHHPEERQMGLIAQEVQEVYPEAVTYDKENDKYGVNYNAIIAPLVQAVKEMRAEYQTLVESLKQEIEDLKARLS
jgi:hypothetical protein